MVPFINKFNLILHILFNLTLARKNNLGRVFGGEEAKPRKDWYFVTKIVQIGKKYWDLEKCRKS